MRFIKYLPVIFSLLLISTSIIGQNLDPKVESILEKYAEAIGMKHRKKIKTLISIGTISQMGTKMQVSILQKRPNKYRMNVHLEDGHISQAYDGKTGWMLNPFVFADTIEIKGVELKQLIESAIFDGILFNTTKLNYTLSYGGIDNIVTSPCHVIILKKPNGDRMRIFIDKESYLIKRTEATFFINGFPVEATSVFSDYRTVQGITLPFMIMNTNGQLTTIIRFNTLRIDEEINDILFAAPKSF